MPLVANDDRSAVLALDVLGPWIDDPTCKLETHAVDFIVDDEALGREIDARILDAHLIWSLGDPLRYLEVLEAIPVELGDLSAAPGHELWRRFHLAEARRETGDVEAAESELRQVIQADPA